ncbi:hypothetical protein FOA52_003908 [Chlamydomonas sp. UWO 241]|nr:hypothetical protein FOA52_003908 [Chlamydomonas sp. UWO 241]
MPAPVISGAVHLPAPVPLAPVREQSSKQKVVLRDTYHAEHGPGGHHKVPHPGDPMFAMEGFVGLLVAAHVLVMIFVAWALLKDRSRAGRKRRGGAAVADGGRAHHAGNGGGAGSSSSSVPSAASSAATAAGSLLSQWRTPKDVLAAREKERLGKV